MFLMEFLSISMLFLQWGDRATDTHTLFFGCVFDIDFYLGWHLTPPPPLLSST